MRSKWLSVAICIVAVAVTVRAVSLDAVADHSTRFRDRDRLHEPRPRLMQQQRDSSSDLPVYIGDFEGRDPFGGKNILDETAAVRKMTAEILERGFKGQAANATRSDYLSENAFPAIDASDISKLPALRKVTIVINNTELFPPYPRNRHGEAGNQTVAFDRYLNTMNNTNDTSREGQGRKGVEVSFPVPYHLFSMFDADKNGLLNYREFVTLMNYINGDYVLPKDQRVASYRLLIETVQGTPVDAPVFVRLIGPTGVATSEKQIRDGFTPGKDVISVDAEDVSVVTNIRLRIGDNPDDIPWIVRKVSVSVHGRVTESKAGNFSIRHSLHIPLAPMQLRLNDSSDVQAMGNTTDDWTEQHYIAYLQHVAAFNHWLEIHMDQQRQHNLQVAANLTAALRNGSNTTTTPAAVTSGESAIGDTQGSSATSASASVASVVSTTASKETTAPAESAPRAAAKSEPTATPVSSDKKTLESAPSPSPNPTNTAAEQKKSAEQKKTADVPTSSDKKEKQTEKEKKEDTEKAEKSTVTPITSKRLSGALADAVQAATTGAPASNVTQSATLSNSSAAAGVTPIRSSPDVKVPAEQRKVEAARIQAIKDKIHKDQETARLQEQKALDSLLGQLAKDEAEHIKSVQDSAQLAAMGELKRAKLHGAKELTFEQKLAALALEIQQEKQHKARENNSTVAKAAKEGNANGRALNGNPRLPQVDQHSKSSANFHMLEAHLPGASWAGEVPKVVNPLANPPGPLPYHTANGVVNPTADWDYTHSGRDWEGPCKGKSQSPIFIRRLAARPSNGVLAPGDTNMVLHYREVPTSAQLTMVNDGRTLSISAYGSMGYVESGINKERYDVQKIMFHAPSEHAFDYAASESGRFDMEMQIYHQKNGSVRADDVLVLAIVYKLDLQNNTFLNSLDWNFLPKKNKRHFLTQAFDLSKATGADNWASPYFSYVGSLTVPPCTEGANWRVMKNPQPVSAAQLQKINKLFAANPNFASGRGNSRVVQKFNNRPGGLTISQ